MNQVYKPDKRRERSEKTRAAILTAAVQCYQRTGVSEGNMDEIAQLAGVGRATVYRHFSNQEALTTAVISHNILMLKQKLARSLKQYDKPEDYFVEAAVIIIQQSNNAGIGNILFADGAVNRLSLSSPTITAMGADFIAPFYLRCQQQGILRGWVTLALLQEWVSRLLLSFLMVPSEELNSEQKMRRFFYDAVVTSIIDRDAGGQ